MIMTWLLIVTALYTGSMAPGADVYIRMDAPALQSQRHCEKTGAKLSKTLAYLGARNIEITCKAMGR
jgi:hypothetical protein